MNILSGLSYLAKPQADSVRGVSQSQGSDELFGRKAAEISAKAKIPDGRKGVQVIAWPKCP